MVPIHNVMGTNIFQVNPLLFKELQSFVHIFQAVDPHTSPRRPWLGEDREMNYYLSLSATSGEKKTQSNCDIGNFQCC